MTTAKTAKVVVNSEQIIHKRFRVELVGIDGSLVVLGQVLCHLALNDSRCQIQTFQGEVDQVTDLVATAIARC